MTPDVHAAQNEIVNPAYENDPIEEKTNAFATAADSWGPVPTKKASLANLAPYLLPYFNNGPVFGLPGTDSRDLRYRTQLSGDWDGRRTDLARHEFFFDLYSTSAYQDVAPGGLKTGSAFIQNTQLSINVDTERAGLWPGGVFHITLEARNGSSSPQDTFTVGSTVPQYTGLAFPGPFFVHDVLPTEYFLFQSLTPKFSVILGKVNVLKYLLSPVKSDDAYKSWISLGAADSFPIGETRLAKFTNPVSRAWDGETDRVVCWVRRIAATEFQVFAVNCAHLGCQCAGFPNRSSSCVRAMVGLITQTEAGRQVLRSVAYLRMTPRSLRAIFRSTLVRCPRWLIRRN